MAWSLLFWLTGWLCLLSRLRYSGPGAPLAWPINIPWPWWPVVTAALFAGAALAAWRGRRTLRDRSARRAWLELWALLTIALGYEWAILGAFAFRPWDIAFLAGFAVVLVVLLIREPGSPREMGLGLANFLPAIKWLAVPTLLVVAACFLIGGLAGAELDGRKLVVSLLTYPLYALVQLTVLLVLVAGRLQRTGARRGEVIVVTSAVFALVHWPNGVVMLGCFLMGLLWVSVYLRRPNLLAAALSMGLAATAFARALPVTWTQNMRTGPIYVERGLEWKQHPPRE